MLKVAQEGDGNILVDVGCNDKAGFEMFVFDQPMNILKQYGILPEQITDIVITHHHHDHIEASGDYPNATIHILFNMTAKNRSMCFVVTSVM